MAGSTAAVNPDEVKNQIGGNIVRPATPF